MIREAVLYRSLEKGRVACFLCGHRCEIAPSGWGQCEVRENREGKLLTHVYGEVVAANVDPIEKKPLYHFLPGTTSFSIAAAGCNFRCGFCQNWQISQSRARGQKKTSGYALPPEEVVRQAVRRGCRSISFTYTEPTIFFEYAYDTARLAKDTGLLNNFVTNGFMTGEALGLIRPFLDAANVDLKSFREETYQKVCKARLQPVLDSIRLMHGLGIWVEVTTLVVPGLNDGQAELTDTARFIAGVDRDIPWHISRFHPDYQYGGTPPTPVATLRRAHDIGKSEGLHYIYVGNLQGESEDTACPGCGKTLIRRTGFSVCENLVLDSKCPACGIKIAGVF